MGYVKGGLFKRFIYDIICVKIQLWNSKIWEGTTVWTVVYMAPNKETAEKVKECLVRESVLVKIRPVHKNSCKDGYYEVLVPESEIEEAHNILYQMGM